MSESVNYTSSQWDTINDLNAYIESYCAAQGISPDAFVASLDGEISTELLNDPAFQAYWQMAYLQLLYLINGGSTDIAAGAAVEYDEGKLMAAYNASSQEMRDFAASLLNDNPEYMALFAMQNSGGDISTANTLLMQISAAEEGRSMTTSTDTDSSSGESAEDSDYVDTQTREFIAKYNSGGSLDFLYGAVEASEASRSRQETILNRLAEMDMQIASFADALKDGSISAEVYDNQVETVSMQRELLLGFLQADISSTQTVMEMYSKMVEQINEMRMSIINNWRGA